MGKPKHARGKGTIAAAGSQDTATWLMGTVVPLLREHFQKVGESANQGGVYTLRVDMSTLLRVDLGLRGSGPRVMEILQKLDILKRIDRGNKGQGAIPPLWSVNMRLNPTPSRIRDALLGLADEHTERRRQQQREQARKEERLAGEYGEQTTGGPVTTTHYHTAELNHPHGTRSGPHYHCQADDKSHKGPRSVVEGIAGCVCWIEYRHHTHPATPATTDPSDLIRQPEPVPSMATTGTVREVREDLAGGRPAMLERPQTDQRYRALLDTLRDRDAEIARLEHRVEEAEEAERTWKSRAETAEARLIEATDPSAKEADDYLARERERKAAR
jgi:hypothetical protein